MTKMQLPGLFITGTDTNVGKSWVSAAIAKCLRDDGFTPGVIKPVATGLTDRFAEDSDAVLLLKNAGWPINATMLNLANPIIYATPAAPTVAAQVEGQRLEWDVLLQHVRESIAGWRNHGADCILIEGVGGLECPIAESRKSVKDLIVELDYPALIVARFGLGTLNHTIGTVGILRNGPARITGVLLNEVPGDDPAGIPERTAADELSGRIAPVAVLHECRSAQSPAGLAAQVRHMQWHSRCGEPRW